MNEKRPALRPPFNTQTHAHTHPPTWVPPHSVTLALSYNRGRCTGDGRACAEPRRAEHLSGKGCVALPPLSQRLLLRRLLELGSAARPSSKGMPKDMKALCRSLRCTARSRWVVLVWGSLRRGRDGMPGCRQAGAHACVGAYVVSCVCSVQRLRGICMRTCWMLHLSDASCVCARA